MQRCLCFLTCGLAICVAGCRDGLEATPQYIVFVDTNLPVASQVATDPTFAAASIDTLRIDVLGDDSCTDRQEVVAPEAGDWPLSFGVIFGVRQASITLRLRGFAAASAQPEESCGSTVLRASPFATIERTVELSAPDDVTMIRVTLDGACLNRRSLFGEGTSSTCVDELDLEASPDMGIERLDRAPTHSSVGTWEPALPTGCEGSGPAGAVCIPGGFTQLGDRALIGFGTALSYVDPAPPRPVAVSPFWMDATEVTVAEIEALDELPEALTHDPEDPKRAFCNLGRGIGDMPMNCISRASASEVCVKRGGALPTEAQWEHAARGRGRGWRFPWGDRVADACIASVDRSGEGTESVASHGACSGQGVGDLSPDGVYDLAGSVAELVRDDPQPFDEGCWKVEGVFQDPVCSTPGSALVASRGGDWASLGSFAASPLRRRELIPSSRLGFRCVYVDEP